MFLLLTSLIYLLLLAKSIPFFLIPCINLRLPSYQWSRTRILLGWEFYWNTPIILIPLKSNQKIIPNSQRKKRESWLYFIQRGSFIWGRLGNGAVLASLRFSLMAPHRWGGLFSFNTYAVCNSMHFPIRENDAFSNQRKEIERSGLGGQSNSLYSALLLVYTWHFLTYAIIEYSNPLTENILDLRPPIKLWHINEKVDL